MGGRADVLREGPQRRHRRLPDQRVHLPAQPQHAEPDAGPSAQVAADEGVLFQRGEQPVHHGPVDAQFVGKLGDGQPVVRVGEQFEDP
ncbi:hypothetical protein SALBM217S_02351 [Streptomyces griseoloalbus]